MIDFQIKYLKIQHNINLMRQFGYGINRICKEHFSNIRHFSKKSYNSLWSINR